MSFHSWNNCSSICRRAELTDGDRVAPSVAFSNARTNPVLVLTNVPWLNLCVCALYSKGQSKVDSPVVGPFACSDRIEREHIVCLARKEAYLDDMRGCHSLNSCSRIRVRCDSTDSSSVGWSAARMNPVLVLTTVPCLTSSTRIRLILFLVFSTRSPICVRSSGGLK